jgi:F420-non-reducing hydrogenase iron-sulfur subunit
MTDRAVGQIETAREAPAAWQPKLVGFLCNWCSFAGADMAGTSRLSYPPAIRIIRVPCTGRVDPLLVAKAFQQGADGVLVSGCHPGDCHYAEGNYYMRRRYVVLQRLLHYLGIEEDRFRLEWVSASEGKKFARVITEFTAHVTGLGPRAGKGAEAGDGAGGLL